MKRGSCALSFGRWRPWRRAACPGHRSLGGVGSPRGKQAHERLHRSAAARAGICGGGFCGRVFQRSDKQRTAGVEGHFLAFGFGRRMTEAMIADRPQSAWQDMAQIAPNELFAGDGLGARLVVIGAVFPTEGDVGAGGRKNARVADGGAADIGESSWTTSSRVITAGSSSWSLTFSCENTVQSPWPGMSMKNRLAPMSSRLGNPRHSPGPAPHSRINLSSSQSAFFLDSGISNVYTDHEIDDLS